MWRLFYYNFSYIWMQDSKNFGWEINGDINFNWKTLLENKVGKKQTLAARSECMFSTTNTGTSMMLYSPAALDTKLFLLYRLKKSLD
jgi:hypothetical protein